jgi:hypothetical protein
LTCRRERPHGDNGDADIQVNAPPRGWRDYSLLRGEKVTDGGGRMRGLFRQRLFGARLGTMRGLIRHLIIQNSAG